MKKVTLLLMYLILILNAFGEKIVLTLDKAIETAQSKEKQIKQAEIDLENYELKKNEAFKGGLPSISYSGMSTLLEDKAYGSNEINQYYVTLSQTLYNGGKTKVSLENAEDFLNLGKLTLENTKNQIELSVSNTYVNIQKLYKQLEILKNSEKLLNENLTKIKRRFELGMIAKTEVLNITESLIDVETSVIQLENSIELSLISLKNSLGIDIDEEVILSNIENLNVDVESIDIENDVYNAKNSNIAMQMQKISTQLTRANEVNSKADLLPYISLSLTYGNQSYVYDDIPEALSGENLSWSAGISISGTLFTWGKNLDAYTRAKNETSIAEYDERISEENIELNVKSAYLELLRLSKLKEARNKALESSQENFKLQEKSYENQLISSTDFLDAENSLRQAEITLMETELDLFYAYQNYLTLIK